ncbi:extracellular solute-binding protein [uncultured Clostridium sp.]|uniref:extracellular solute-binding protein n=1 Tax=uncultured Clostridium sp. TaxID=59620 RepID=UPI0025D627AB|nr:extracellular solute-binding protein [uncultured Clostridium sp.]
MTKKKMYAMISLIALTLLVGIAGCNNREKTAPKSDSPVVITLWHSYNAVAKIQFDKLIQEFNDTVGLEKDIIVDAKGYGSSDELEEVLYASANRMIGSEPLPDIFASYPDSAYRLDKLAPLVPLERYFTAEEFQKYQPEFLEEGVWDEEGHHKMLPVAKSTELLYLNKTDWERFSEETGVSKAQLGSWEGLAEVAELYYGWSGGKPFLGMNYYNDFSVMAAAQLGETIYGDSGRFEFSREAARKAWEAYYVPHVMGWYESREYNQDGVKSGKLMAYIGSSAGAGFFPGEIIENEEKSYPIECECFPYPTFDGGTGYMTQRGADMGVFASDGIREEAACEFLKWFTAPEQNIRFAVATGYLPVEEKALESVPELLNHVDRTNNAEAIGSSIRVFLDARKQRPFYIKKAFEGSYDKNKFFAESLENKTVEAQDIMKRRLGNGEIKEDVQSDLLSEDCFSRWYDSLIKEMAGITDGEKD